MLFVNHSQFNLVLILYYFSIFVRSFGASVRARFVTIKNTSDPLTLCTKPLEHRFVKCACVPNLRVPFRPPQTHIHSTVSFRNNNRMEAATITRGFRVGLCLLCLCWRLNNIVLVYLFILRQMGIYHYKNLPRTKTSTELGAGFVCLPRCEWNADDIRFCWGPNAQTKYLTGTTFPIGRR